MAETETDQEEDAHTFVVRLWEERSPREEPPGSWRGHVTHLPEGRRRYVQDLGEVDRFVASYLRRMGLEPHPATAGTRPQPARPVNILITGTSYGLGAAISERVRGRGDRVFSMSRTAPCEAAGERWIRADIGNLEEIEAAADRLAEELAGERLGGVVFNAALADKSRSQWTVEQVERHFRINALGPFALWTALEEGDLIDDPCNVVLMGSFLQNGNVRQPAYAMSKAALWSWMRSYTMAQEGVAPVSMNMIWPGRVLTPANPPRELPPGDPNLFYTPERVAEVAMHYLYQPPNGPRGTVLDMGRS